jgi:hypothetical protein
MFVLMAAVLGGIVAFVLWLRLRSRAKAATSP